MIFNKNKFEIYTDGSHKGKWGSWAFVIVKKGRIIHEAWGRERKTNSHRMEFQAAIEALSYLKNKSVITLYSDSKILIDCFDQNERPSVHQDQIEKLDQISAQHKISWKWVRAHAGILYNERCDQLCVQARGDL